MVHERLLDFYSRLCEGKTLDRRLQSITGLRSHTASTELYYKVMLLGNSLPQPMANNQ